jgi:hypothetical protein
VVEAVMHFSCKITIRLFFNELVTEQARISGRL